MEVQVDTSDTRGNAARVELSANVVEQHSYWWLNSTLTIEHWADVASKEEMAYSLYHERGYKRSVFSHFEKLRPGDPIVLYSAWPVLKVEAIGQVTKAQDGTNFFLEKVTNLENPPSLSEIQDDPRLKGMECLNQLEGSLFALSADEYAAILDLAGLKVSDIDFDGPAEDKGNDAKEVVVPYGREDFLSQVFMSERNYDRLRSILLKKKNLILQGAPGVGKTFCARRLAWSIMGEVDDSRIEMVQFHQSYSYEDFVMGYKPVDDGFALKEGVFFRMCKKAAADPDREYFFIIDEINRGNLSKIFGELMMLIECDYRGQELTLAYRDELFSVPENLYLIGMMNTADRSLALIDYALRRRFVFFEMMPGFDAKGFKDYQASLKSTTFNRLVDKVKVLNAEIENDPMLGKGFMIGHSHFCGQETVDDEWLLDVVDFDIIPTLEEYWFDDKDKVDDWKDELHGVFL